MLPSCNDQRVAASDMINKYDMKIPEKIGKVAENQRVGLLRKEMQRMISSTLIFAVGPPPPFLKLRRRVNKSKR